MLKTIAIVIVVLWLLGLIAGVAEGLIHLLLLVAAAVFIYDLVAGRSKKLR